VRPIVRACPASLASGLADRYSRLMADGGMPRTKRCPSCGGEYLLEFFRLGGSVIDADNSKTDARRHHDRCIGCEAVRKREELVDARLRRKAVTARRRHGAKLKDLGVIKSADDLEELYGWLLERMVDDIERVIEKGCPYCLRQVSIAENGLGMITLDIPNADQSPYYATNVVWCCSRCNSGKHRTSPDVWGARQSMWNRWRLNQIRLGVNPDSFGSLSFADSKADQQPTLF
jgi:hypothetical protein